MQEGYNDSEIVRTLNLTRITVSKLKYFYESHGERYEIALKVLANEKLLKDVKDILRELATYAVRAAGGRIKFPDIL